MPLWLCLLSKLFLLKYSHKKHNCQQRAQITDVFFFNIFAAMSESLSRQQLIDIAKEFGTPAYVYHAEKIKEQFNKLVSAFSVLDTKFFYCLLYTSDAADERSSVD